MTEERLQKVIARYGACSRRHAERWILSGRVAVNGSVVTCLGTKVDPSRDIVAVDGRQLHPLPRDYWAVHKPASVARFSGTPISLRSNGASAPSSGRLFPAGRLSAATAGLLLLTNDGPFAGALTAPGTPIDEDYVLRVVGRPAAEDLRRLRRGTDLDGRQIRPARIEPILEASDADGTAIAVTVRDRATRARLRWLFDTIGHPVLWLSRQRFGPVALGSLPEGSSRRLTLEERSALRALAGVS